MKWLWRVLWVFVLVVGFYSFVLAQDKKDAMGDKDMMQGGMGMMDKDKMMGMGHMMMGKSLVSTPDGGVIVLMGNKLQKYDKDLNLVKEVEIKMDMDKDKECPMFKMQGKYHKGDMTGGEDMKKEEPMAGHKAQPGPVN